jgi:cardiolipin synthase
LFAQRLHQRLSEVIETQSYPVNASFMQRHWRQRLRDLVAFGLMRLALFITGHRY